MVQIAFLLLCHKDPDAVVAQARRLTGAGDCVAIHFDARAPEADFRQIREALAGNPNVAFTPRRRRCGWGEWSLVAATLDAAREALETFPGATHFYLLSGDCMPIKSARYAHDLLEADDVDFIESEEFFQSGWIRTGLIEERLIYRHYFNERNWKGLFYASLSVQKRLRLKRSVPDGLQMMIGSQWWCLRRGTLEAILEFCRKRRDVVRFFATTWIPDESYFQTLVRHLVPRQEIRSRSLTFLLFSDYGMPVTFYNDHHDLLLGQDALFARKISPEAADLKARLGRLYASRREAFPISGEGTELYRYMTGRGREGRRFAPRFWEADGLNRDAELLLVVSKKWHVARRLTEAIRQKSGIAAVDFVFNEQDAGLPDLGGIERSLDKRTRHRRVLVSMLFDYFGTGRLVLCLDPSMIEILQDFSRGGATVRILEIDCELSDAFLAGHAARLGLLGEGSPAAVVEDVLQALRRDVEAERDCLVKANFPHHHRLREGAPETQNAVALAEFLSIPVATARRIVADRELFFD